MKKTDCDQLVDGVAASILEPSGFQKQRTPRWVRTNGHFFVAIGLPWSRGVYRIVTGVGCDRIPYAKGWRRPQAQMPGKLEYNFHFADTASWTQGDRWFSHEPIIDRHFSLEKVTGYFKHALREIEQTVPKIVTKQFFLDAFERKRSSRSSLPFDFGVDHMIVDYVIKSASGNEAPNAVTLLVATYESEDWRPMLDTAALDFAGINE